MGYQLGRLFFGNQEGEGLVEIQDRLNSASGIRSPQAIPSLKGEWARNASLFIDLAETAILLLLIEIMLEEAHQPRRFHGAFRKVGKIRSQEHKPFSPIDLILVSPSMPYPGFAKDGMD